MTAIQWTDVTDNIIVAAQGGWWCRKISPGCANCYAAELNQSEYFHGNKLAYGGDAPVLKLREDIIDSWPRQTKPKRHFIASMTDVFGEWLPQAWIFRMLDGMAAAPRQTFQVLTKRASEMRQEVDAWLTARNLSVVPAHIWLGVSVENQTFADERIPHLLATRASVRFLSVEPLLGPVRFADYRIFGGMNGIHWLIVGGESGKNARPCNVEWIRSIVRQCAAADVSLFVKQLGTRACWSAADDDAPLLARMKHKKGGSPEEWPADLRIRQFPKESR
jgi:protein gp37